MRLAPILAALILPAAAFAQTAAPPPGVGVDRVTLHPGETKAFTLAPGQAHQLLVATDPAHPAAKVIRSDRRHVAHHGDQPHRTTLGFTVLADPDGDGGFKPAGDIADLPGNGTLVSRDWPGNLGMIKFGDFVGGPHGDHPHQPSGG